MHYQVGGTNNRECRIVSSLSLIFIYVVWHTELFYKNINGPVWVEPRVCFFQNQQIRAIQVFIVKLVFHCIDSFFFSNGISLLSLTHYIYSLVITKSGQGKIGIGRPSWFCRGTLKLLAIYLKLIKTVAKLVSRK